MPGKTPIFRQRTDTRQDLKVICHSCHKQIKNSIGRGSFTAWLFRDTTCRCKTAGSATGQLTMVPQESPDQASASAEPNLSGAGPPARGSSTPADKRQPLLDASALGLEDRYDVLRCIGQGGMGSVYEVRERSTGTHYALKMLRAELVADEGAIQRLQREAKTAMNLSHKNLCTVYGAGTSATNVPYLVMELVEGRSLASLLEEEIFLGPSTAVPIFLQICDGLSHAHTMHVLHRDLKPGNVIIGRWLTGVDRLKVVDFGIAKSIAPAATSATNQLTQTGELIGSPLYMSPEQCRGEQLNAQSDIYSLGCVMYEVLTGKPPFTGNNPVTVILQHLNDRPARFNKSLDVPAVLEAIVLKCLAKSPDQRYQSVDDLYKDLDAFSQGTAPKIAVGRKSQMKFQNRAEGSSLRVMAVPLIISAWFGVMICAMCLRGSTNRITALPTIAPAYAPLMPDPELFSSSFSSSSTPEDLQSSTDMRDHTSSLTAKTNPSSKSNLRLLHVLTCTQLDHNFDRLFGKISQIVKSGDKFTIEKTEQSLVPIGGILFASKATVSFDSVDDGLINCSGLYIQDLPAPLVEIYQIQATRVPQPFRISSMHYIKRSSGRTLVISGPTRDVQLTYHLRGSDAIERVDLRLPNPVNSLPPGSRQALTASLRARLSEAHSKQQPMNVSIQLPDGKLTADNPVDAELLEALSQSPVPAPSAGNVNHTNEKLRKLP